MRDGVRLATDIYRPALNGVPVPGRFPMILGRTSYDRSPVRKGGERSSTRAVQRAATASPGMVKPTASSRWIRSVRAVSSISTSGGRTVSQS